MPGPETFVPNLIGAWRADTRSGSDLTDLSGNGRTLFAGPSPVFSTTSTLHGWGVAGNVVATQDGSVDGSFTAASATPWKPAHDGTGATLGCIFRATGTVFQVLFSTGAELPSGAGIYVWYDAALERIIVELTRYSTGGRVIDWFIGNRGSWKRTAPKNLPHACLVTLSAAENPAIKIWIDGHLVDQFNEDDRQRGSSFADPEPRTFDSTEAASFPLRIMSQANVVVQPLIGEWGEAFVSSSVLSAPNRELFWQWASTHWGIPIDRSAPGLIIWEGDSVTDNFWKTGQFPEVVTPLLRQPTTNFMRAIAGRTITQQAAMRAKQTIASLDFTRPFNIVVVWGDFINEIGAGTTKEATYAAYVAYCQALQTAGAQVVSAPPPPWAADASHVASDYLTTQVVTNWPTFSDAIARLDLVSQLGNASFATDYAGGSGPHAIWEADGTHFTPAANASDIAPAFVTAINSLLRRRVVVAKRP